MDPAVEYVVRQLELSSTSLAAVDGSDSNNFEGWYKNWEQVFDQADSISRVGSVKIWGALQGFWTVKDAAVIASKKTIVYDLITDIINVLSSNNTTRDLITESISKVTNHKLQVLLTQFNNVKDTAPDLAAIGSRTIIAMIIILRAKLVDSTSALAKVEDMNPQTIIDSALKTNIFDSGQMKLLNGFRNGPKKSFDNVTHKFGDTNLASKNDIDNFILLLNSLLPSIASK